jgi:type II secretory ATPase GspE/PulE/Tfp pilus assembly ATPase PilB-like protein
MVGEVRDGPTAQTVLEASLTGHLVLTTTHSHDVFAALQRLEKLGCSRMVLAQSLSLLMVQKLVRRVCPACVAMEEPPEIVRNSLMERGLLKTGTTTPMPVARGCERCSQTGFAGRVAVVETLTINEALRGVLISGASLAEVKEAAERENLLITMRQYAVYLMAGRLITPGDALVTITA